MIIKILGVCDIISGLLIFLNSMYNFIPETIMLVAGFYLLIKGIVFVIGKDFASIIDVICSLVIFISLAYSIPYFISVIIFVFLLQKGIFSLLS